MMDPGDRVALFDDIMDDLVEYAAKRNIIITGTIQLIEDDPAACVPFMSCSPDSPALALHILSRSIQQLSAVLGDVVEEVAGKTEPDTVAHDAGGLGTYESTFAAMQASIAKVLTGESEPRPSAPPPRITQPDRPPASDPSKNGKLS